jgi:hypothetical protein
MHENDLRCKAAMLRGAMKIKHGVATCDPLLIKACASGAVAEVFPNFLSLSLSSSLSLSLCQSPISLYSLTVSLTVLKGLSTSPITVITLSVFMCV